MGLTSAGVVSFLAGLIWWTCLWVLQGKLPIIVNFGSPEKRALSAPERHLIISEHLRQQRWAFALVWFSAAVAVLLGGLLLGRLLLTSTCGSTVANTVAWLGDISVGTAAYTLYKKSSTQFHDVLKDILADQIDKSQHATQSSGTAGRH